MMKTEQELTPVEVKAKKIMNRLKKEKDLFQFLKQQLKEAKTSSKLNEMFLKKGLIAEEQGEDLKVTFKNDKERIVYSLAASINVETKVIV